MIGGGACPGLLVFLGAACSLSGVHVSPAAVWWGFVLTHGWAPLVVCLLVCWFGGWLGPLDSCRVARLVRAALPPCAVRLGAAARTKVNTAAQVTGVFCQNAIESASLDQAGPCGARGRLHAFVDKHHNYLQEHFGDLVVHRCVVHRDELGNPQLV